MMFHDTFLQKTKALNAGMMGPEGLLANPLFNVGMGLLASGYDQNVNPYQAAVGGLISAQQQQTDALARQRDEEMRQQLADFFAQQEQEKQRATAERLQAQGLLGPVMEPPPRPLEPVPPPVSPMANTVPFAPAAQKGLSLDMVSPMTADLMRRYALMNLGR